MEAEPEKTYGQIPSVYKEDKAALILLADGCFDLTIGIMYILFLRSLLMKLSAPVQEMGLVDFNIMLLFDIVIFLEFTMAILELIAVFFIKFSENEKVPDIIKKLFIISHLILIPLGGLIDVVINYIMM